MQAQLVIYLHAHDLSQPSWVVIDETGMVQPTTTTLLQEAAVVKTVIVLVPAEDVWITQVQLPKMNRTRLLQAVPYALEDQLIDEVDKLHFAIGESAANNVWPVAVVAHEKMQQWLQVLQALTIQPDIMLPVSLALPYSDMRWMIALYDEMAIARLGQYQGFACDPINLTEWLTLLLSTNPPPAVIDVTHYQATTGNPRWIGQSMINGVKIEETSADANPFLVDVDQAALLKPAINLLQRSHAVKKSKLPQMNKLWQTVLVLCVIWISMLLLYPTVSYFILKQRDEKLQEAITQIYQTHFPQAKNIIAPKLRLEEKVRKLAAKSNDNRVLVLLAAVGTSMQQVKNINLKRMDYQQKQLTVELNAGSPEEMTAFTQTLTQQGLQVKQQQANLVGSKVQATLLIE
ncbi:MAG TPA: type II secretion system protein GspL [Gammaproteobacteria bacterium]|nr:type II secretion system protein GspL [Gammaproteobacteria bacterium]